MKAVLLSIFLSFSCYISAQQFNWVTSPPFSSASNVSGLGYSVTIDPSGNVIVAGYKEQPFNYTDVFGTVAITKYNSEGSTQWSKTMGGHAIVYAIETDTAGNILVAAGYVNSITIGDFGLITINQGIQFIALKFDPQGNLLWHMPIAEGDPFMNGFRCITSDSANNIYIAYDDYNNSWIQKLSATGELLLTITQTGLPMLSSISVDASGNIHVAGSCANLNSMFAGVAAPTTLSYSGYVVRYSPSGTYQWHHYIEDITCEKPRVVAHSSEEIYFSAQLFGAYPFGTLTTLGPQTGGFADFYLAKLNGAGQFQWVREVPGVTGGAQTGHRNFMDTDAAGNIYFTGSYSGTIHWSENISTTSANFQDDGLLVIYNNEGQVINAMGFGSVQHDRVDGITVDPSGIFITGISHGNATFGELPYNGGSQYYPYLTKLSPLPLNLPESDSVPVKLYPNPATDHVYFSSNHKETAQIYTLQGQKITQIEVGGNIAGNITALQAGVYIVDIGSQKFKLIKTD